MINRRIQLDGAKAMQVFQVMRQGSLLLIAIALAKLGLPQEMVGIYELLTFAAYLLTFFWVSALQQSLLVLYPTLDDQEQRSLLGLAYAAFVALSLPVAGIFAFQPAGFLQLLGSHNPLPYTVWFAVFLLANTPAYLQEYYYLLTGRSTALLLYGAITAGGQFAVVALPVALGFDFEYAFIGLAVLGIAKWLWLSIFVYRLGNLKWSAALRRKYLRPTRPLVLYSLLSSLSTAVGPWMVGFFYPGREEIFAIYRYGAREVPLLPALGGALSSALLPSIVTDKDVGLAETKRRAARLSHIVFPVAIGLMLSSDWWFTRVFSEDYRPSIALFNVLLFTTAAHPIFSRTVMLAFGRERILPWMVVASIIVHIVAAFIFGGQFGLVGIAAATVCAIFFEKILTVALLWRMEQIAPAVYWPIRLWGIYTSLLLAAWWWVSWR